MTIKNRIDMVIKIGHTIKDRETDTLEMAIKIEILTEETNNMAEAPVEETHTEAEATMKDTITITTEITDPTVITINSHQAQQTFQEIKLLI